MLCRVATMDHFQQTVYRPTTDSSCSVLPRGDYLGTKQNMDTSVLPPMEWETSRCDTLAPAETPSGGYQNMVLSTGLLKLSISIDHRLLTVHVHKARHLNYRGLAHCCSFVKISLHPDTKSIFETQVIPNTASPRFNEKFSHQLKPEDLTKRLMMSVYHKDSAKGCNELIGCMSFGIKSLLAKKRKVDGCFHLMAEHIGQRKHIQAKSSSEAKKAAEQQQSAIPEMNKCLPQDQVSTVLLTKGSHGYGFTVRGSCPVRIGRIKKEGTAHQHGLHRGDFIVRINGQNISRSSAESVARLVRLAEEQIELDIYCPHDNNETVSDVSSEGTELDKAMLQAPDGASMSCSFEENPSEMKSVTRSPSVRSAVHNTSRASGASRTSRCSHHSSKKRKQLDCTVWNPDLSVIPQSGHLDSGMVQSERLTAIDSLVECEQNFVEQMHQGILWYSRPFRHCVLTTKEHSLLFQNLEKMVAISEFHITQLLDGCADELSEDGAVGKAYESRAYMLCEAYDIYAEGFAKAIAMLQELRNTEKFKVYMKQMSGMQEPMSIESFIQWPLKHIVELCESLVNVLNATSPDHHDYDSLSKVTQGLKKTCIYIRDLLVKINDPHCSGNTTCYSSPGSCSEVSSRSRSSSRSTMRSRSSVVSLDSSVDPELLELQKLLVFSDRNSTFKIAVPDRHLIYAGELDMTDTGATFYVILLSDVLLLTQHKGSHLVIVDEPIYLSDVIALDSGSHQLSEFSLTLQHGHALKELTLSASSSHEKHAWINLLERHLPASVLTNATMTTTATTTATTTSLMSAMMSTTFATSFTDNTTTNFSSLMSTMNTFSDLSATSTIAV